MTTGFLERLVFPEFHLHFLLTDLSPLHGSEMVLLAFTDTKVSDVTPLQGMSLRVIAFTPGNITTGTDVIRNMDSLVRINDMPAKEFWKKYDAGEFGNPTP